MSAKKINNAETVMDAGSAIKKAIPFLNFRWVSLGGSFLLILAGVIAYFLKGGLQLGIDFTGGTRMEIHIDNEAANVSSVRTLFTDPTAEVQITTVGAVENKNFLITISSNAAGVPVEKSAVKEKAETTAVVTNGTNVVKDVVKTSAIASSSNEDVKIMKLLKAKFGEDKVKLRGQEFVGAKMGDLFIQRSMQLILVVSMLILVYVAIRFNFVYGIGAVAAIIHDILIMLAFSIVIGIRVDVTIIAAFLTILGYSINDSIVVFDRVRENHKLNPDEDFKIVMNKSITQSLSRTVVTSITTLLVAIAIFGWSGRVLRDFGLLMIIGIVSGTYSSIFIASPITYIYRKLVHPRWTEVKKQGKGSFVMRNLVAWSIPMIVLGALAVPFIVSNEAIAANMKMTAGVAIVAGEVVLSLVIALLIGLRRWKKHVETQKA